MMNRYYAGIGSRDTNKNILDLMKTIASTLANDNLILRSGGANGADKAFEDGCDLVNGDKEIFIVKNSNYSIISKNNKKTNWKEFSKAASDIFFKYHPKANSIKNNYVKGLLTRDGFQVLGEDLNTPCLFVLCWTKDGVENNSSRTINTGGTGQAISIASDKKIPVFNFKNENRINDFFSYYEKLKSGL